MIGASGRCLQLFVCEWAGWEGDRDVRQNRTHPHAYKDTNVGTGQVRGRVQLPGCVPPGQLRRLGETTPSAQAAGAYTVAYIYLHM